MTAAETVQSVGTGQGGAWWFLDCLVVELSPVVPGRPVVFEMALPEGASPPLHVHQGLDDDFYLLEGRMVVRRGDDVAVAGAGSWVPTPGGVPHTFRVVGGPARALQVHADDSFLRLVHDIGQPAGTRELPVATGGPGIEELERALSAHGITTVGPSISDEEAQRWLAGGRDGAGAGLGTPA